MYYSNDNFFEVNNEILEILEELAEFRAKRDRMKEDNYEQLQCDIQKLTSKENPMTAKELEKALKEYGCPFNKRTIASLAYVADVVKNNRTCTDKSGDTYQPFYNSSTPNLCKRKSWVTRYFAEVTPEGKVIPGTMKAKDTEINVYWVE